MKSDMPNILSYVSVAGGLNGKMLLAFVVLSLALIEVPQRSKGR